jgi:excinuclease ABC subunit C
VPGGRQAREAVRRLNDWFGLRDCPQKQEMVFADQGELFPVVRAAGCIRHEIGTCLGPCTGRNTRASYQVAVRAAEAFLAGSDLSALTAIEQEMQAASVAMAFERAGALRDKLEVLRWLREQMDSLKRAGEQPPFIYPVHGADGRHFWYAVAQGRVTAVLPAPRDEVERQTRLNEARKACRRRGTQGRCLATDEVDGVLLVASWFRRYPQERGRAIPLEV